MELILELILVELIFNLLSKKVVVFDKAPCVAVANLFSKSQKVKI